MNKLTSITRKEIFSLLAHGYKEPSLSGENVSIQFNFYGTLSCVDFLNRLYDLTKLPSSDSRLSNAAEDIYRHTVLNPNDYPEDWLFTDQRFPLCNGTDEQLLDFLCEIFNPEVREEQSNWRIFHKKINELIGVDGYEFYIDHIISNKIAYSWRRKNYKFRVIKPTELYSLIGLFNRGGHVLDFNTGSFDNFTKNVVGFRLTEYYGLSKGKSLAAYVEEGNENDIIKLIVALFDYYVSNSSYDNEKKGVEYQEYQKIIERVRLGILPINEFAKELEQHFSSEYMSSQISIMMQMTKENPTEAIGKAKELIESCCKTILEERNILCPKDDSVGQLTKKVMKLLKVTPQNINDKHPAADAMRKILGNLSAISEGIATLRNSYGSGHGKPASYKGLEERHAKLAVGSSITLVEFLWCTHERTKKTQLK